MVRVVDVTVLWLLGVVEGCGGGGGWEWWCGDGGGGDSGDGDATGVRVYRDGRVRVCVCVYSCNQQTAVTRSLVSPPCFKPSFSPLLSLPAPFLACLPPSPRSSLPALPCSSCPR